MGGRARAVAGVALLLAAAFLWRQMASEEREIARRLERLAGELNATTTADDGFGALARAARLSAYFTPDVVVEFGSGRTPIEGRETLMGIATRLQPRTAAFSVQLADITVELAGEDRAHATLTAVIRRSGGGEDAMDAREFAVDLGRAGGEWRISRVTAVDPLR